MEGVRGKIKRKEALKMETLNGVESVGSAASHASTHENGGADEIDCSGLAGRSIWVDIGTPSAAHFALGDLTADGDWHDLDLSSIVPSGTISVSMHARLASATVSAQLHMREKGNSNFINNSFMPIQVANITIGYTDTVKVDSNRVIEYWLHNSVWTTVDLIIRSYFI